MRVERPARQAHPHARPGVFVVIQLGLGPILRHGEIGPPIPVVVREGRAALIAVHHDPGDLAGHGLERAIALAAQQQSATGIVAGGPGLRREEVLREEHVLMAVAVEVGDPCVERGRELRFDGERNGLETPPAIKEDLMVQRRGLETPGALHTRAQDGRQCGIRVRGERARADAPR